ncbi:MAG: hypothetical protein ACLT3G_14770 [Acutalibacteraceae bacterium]
MTEAVLPMSPAIGGSRTQPDRLVQRARRKVGDNPAEHDGREQQHERAQRLRQRFPHAGGERGEEIPCIALPVRLRRKAGFAQKEARLFGQRLLETVGAAVRINIFLHRLGAYRRGAEPHRRQQKKADC